MIPYTGMKRSSLIFPAAWTVFALSACAATRREAWSGATVGEIFFCVVFVFLGLLIAWESLNRALSFAWRKSPHADAIATAGAVSAVLLIEIYWRARAVMPAMGFFAPARLLVLVAAAAACAVVFRFVRGAASVQPRRRPANLLLTIALLVFAAQCYHVFASRRWDYRLFESRRAAANASEQLPNLVLITLDTVSARYTSLHGYEHANTPTMEAVAREGTVFDRMLCQAPLTGPSHATIMTGLTPRRHGVLSNRNRLGADFDTLAEILKERGYDTAQFVNVFMCGEAGGLRQGFDTAYLRGRAQAPYYEIITGATVFDVLNRAAEKLSERRRGIRPGGELPEVVKPWLAARRGSGRPFFLWYHSYIPHLPYDPPPELRKRFGLAPDAAMETFEAAMINRNKTKLSASRVNEARMLYAAEIAAADHDAGRIAAMLEEFGLAEATMLIITSDHGEAVYEHGGYIGHAERLHNTITEVPCVIRFPRGRHAGIRIQSPARLVDLMPTFLDAAGLGAPGKIDGKSLLPLIENNAQTPEGGEETIFIETFPPEGGSLKTAAVRGEWKLVVAGAGRGKVELHNTFNDPEEEHNLAHDRRYSKIVSELRHEIDVWLASQPAAKAIPVDKKTDKMLKSLGYVK